MSKIIFITGGARGGKSSYAQKRAEEIQGTKVYLATCPKQTEDKEMQARIERHRDDRQDRGWITIEEPLHIEDVIKVKTNVQVLLIDCLTLWISNLMGASPHETLQEDEVESRCLGVLAEAKKFPGTIFFVSNEVGLGIVPENALARSFRDLVGRCNQVMAQGADEAVLVSCGLPLLLKK